MIGTVVVDEIVFPIVGIRLTGGTLRISAVARGPMPAIRLVDCVVHGDDGRVIYRSSRTEGPVVGPLDAKSSLTITMAVEITGHTSQPLGPVRVS